MLLYVLHILFWFICLATITTYGFVIGTFGNIDLSQMLFFAQTNLNGIPLFLVLKILFFTLLIPLIMTLCLVLIYKHLMKNKIIIALLDILLVLIIFANINELIFPYINREQTDLYSKRFKFVNDVKITKPRNLIVLFVESMEEKYAIINDKIHINDSDAIKFTNFAEGYAQRWTQGALFSALTGVHIHYLSEYIFNTFSDKLRFRTNSPQNSFIVSNRIGEKFSFNTPSIVALSDISKTNGYQNLYVQSASLDFSGTKNFLLAHGFSDEHIYGYENFKNSATYNQSIGWWGIDDNSMLSLFESKIEKLKKDQPFLAIAFTLDLHFGKNPFYQNNDDLLKGNIKNINNFIAWYKKQDFYDNTSLIIIGDHKRMGMNVTPGDISTMLSLICRIN